MARAPEKRRLIDKIGECSRVGHALFDDFYNRPSSISANLINAVQRDQLILGSKGKFKPNLKPVPAVGPWFQTRTAVNRSCSLWHEFFFELFDFVPRRCRHHCWKTVFVTNALPSREKVSDLFKVRDLLATLDMPSKCGVDVRPYTPCRYPGFIYGDSLEEGRYYHSIFKDRFYEMFPYGNVILKRSCTEFEHRYGDSSKWDEKYGERWDAWEDYLDYLVERPDDPYPHGILDHMDADTFRYWIEYAHGIGDTSWKVALREQGYKAPKSLFFEPVTYHEE